MDKNQPTQQRRYITGFDGLRALGVLGVILYHMNPNVFKGGYLGVPIFFIISGYLITDQLVRQYQTKGSFNFKVFFTKRLKRIYPALCAVLFATSAYIVLFQRSLLENLHKIVLTNLLNVYNWWQIVNGQSYFERFANSESPFTHLWTLSIEGQFYIVWPVLMVIMLKLLKKRSHIFNITMILAIASAVLMAVLYQPHVDPSRIYYGTDTRMFSILFGCALAILWPSSRLKKGIETRDRVLLDAIGIVCFVGMAFLFLNLTDQGAALYRGGMFVFSLLATILIAVIAHPGADWNQVLTNKLFTWIGARSYGIYLYQFPVMLFFEARMTNIADHQVTYHIIEAILILVISELSFRYIEQPIAHFDFKQTGQFLKQLVTFNNSQKRATKVVSFLAVLIFAIGMTGVVQATTVKPGKANDSALAQKIKKNKATNAKRNAALISEAKKANAEKKKAAKDASYSKSVSVASEQSLEKQAKKHPVNQDLEKYGLTQVQLQRAQTLQVTAFGDSVMLDGQNMLQQIFPKMVMEADVGKQLVAVPAEAKALADKGALADNILVGLGTNGPFTLDQMDALMSVFGPQRTVYWINVRVPTREWQNDVNATLQQAKKRYKNLVVIDWFGYANSHDDWFYDDRVHPNTTGGPYYAAFIAKHLLEDTPQNTK
ncbi:acyltransferase [Agrilactobacillus composti DSM 18527 = JCM 14202]|uniref:Acyltransferase n=1 Tax=Agrilactobacillus composti DSM 18527 = JCM 14202 TaxID=1423734 RepID=X0QKH0_9LACO|nr:acyltransferase family protein [Agrilactobacillus composti]KRM36579.1 acyltransferase [Agrilactobacillus composti DSM 18527 = JCM 14202]GAF39100.1 acyltransferase [Agrilactobacillus composti DSM 18527 = JCM 14202]